MTLPDQPLLIVSAALGIASHIFYFRYGEHQQQGVYYIRLSLAALPLLGLALATQTPLLIALKAAAWAELIYFVALFTSIALYRLSPSHRLAKFPGPLTWKLSKLTQSVANRNLRGFEELDKLHRRYGEYVRTGPSEISIIDPDAIEVILGSSSNCTRTPWYEINPLRSILTVRNENEHRAIRKAYEHGLREQALASYQDSVVECVSIFVRLLRTNGSSPIDMSRWAKLLILDINNRCAFSDETNALETGKPPSDLKYLEDGLSFLGSLGPIPWFFILLLKIPFIRSEFNQGAEFCRRLVEERLRKPNAGPDIVGSIINWAPPTSSDYELSSYLAGESNVLVVAANDAITSTLVFSLYHLAQQPEHAKLIRAELQQIKVDHGPFDAKILRTYARHLNAVINETMRLHPGNPSGAVRLTPKGGVNIKERHVAEDVVVGIPSWSIMRSPKCFVRPDEFIPERWTTEPELILRRDAFIPFYLGAYGCVGKQLALMELRIVLAHILSAFEMSFAPGETGETLVKKSKDHFNMSVAPLSLIFTELYR